MAQKPLQKWILKRYSKLWDAFHNTQFNFKQAEDTVGDNSEIVSIVLSELRRRKLIETTLDKKNASKRLYKLKSFDDYMGNVVKMMLKEIKE